MSVAISEIPTSPQTRIHLSSSFLIALISHTWFSEEMAKRAELGSRITGKRVTQLVNIIDIKDVGLAARKMLKIFSTTSHIDQNFYPETVRRTSEIGRTEEDWDRDEIIFDRVEAMNRMYDDSHLLSLFSLTLFSWALFTSSIRHPSFLFFGIFVRLFLLQRLKRR